MSSKHKIFKNSTNVNFSVHEVFEDLQAQKIIMRRVLIYDKDKYESMCTLTFVEAGEKITDLVIFRGMPG